MMARARQLAGSTPAFDALLGIVASSEGTDLRRAPREKVGRLARCGSRRRSHDSEPSAEGDRDGVALGAPPWGPRPTERSDRGRLVRRREREPRHLAGVQHRAVTRRGSACRARSYFVCEDNGIGSACRPRPAGSRRATGRSHLRYLLADGEIDEVWATAAEAIGHVGRTRQPAFLHSRRSAWGHAGSDAEHRTTEVEGHDRIVRTRAASSRSARGGSPEELRAIVADTRDRVVRAARRRGGRGSRERAGRGGGAARALAPGPVPRRGLPPAPSTGESRRGASAMRCRKRPRTRTPGPFPAA